MSAPVLSCDAMVKMTKIKPELITDPNMYIFFEKGTRGAISYISNRYSKVNNKYLKSYDPKQESNHIIYLGANNLYGYVMYKFLSTSGFKWIDPKEFDLNINTNNNSKGCTLEVDLEYPKELHKLHNDYPLAPDKGDIKRGMLSEYQLKIADLYNIPIGNVKELVPNLFDKEKYGIHYENLKFYLKLGLKLKTIHDVLEFKQSQWLKIYIEFNTQKRLDAEKNNDNDGKAWYKLMNNAIYGKTMKNFRKRVTVQLINNEKHYLKCTSKPSYATQNI